MSNSNGKISSPVVNNPSGGDIQTVFGVTSGDVGTLCKLSNINKWARYKPIRHTSKGVVTHSQRVDAFFGLSLPYCINANMHNKAYDILNRDDTGWTYSAPSGTATSPYRQSDYGAISNDSSDPHASGSGYHHDAQIPMQVLLNEAGITHVGDGAIGNGIASISSYYDINKQATSEFAFTFKNSNFKDLNFQDFINVGTYDTDKKWRPVFQIWRDSQWGGDAPTPIYTGAGNPFTTWYQESTTMSVSVNTSVLSTNQLYHMCIGIGCCNDDASGWYSYNGHGTDYLYLPPFDFVYPSNIFKCPFYFPFKVSSHEERKITVTDLWYFDDGAATWKKATGTAPYFQVGANMAQRVRVKMTITKQPNVGSVYFVPEYPSSAAHTPYFRIIGKESLNGGTETTRYLTPTNSSWTNVTEIEIPQGAQTSTVTLYATMLTNVSRGQTKNYHMYSKRASADFAHNGYFSITRS